MAGITSTPMNDICRDVVKAATEALKAHGFERPSVVVNFAWKDHDLGPYACGTAIPRAHRALMRDSLEQSVEEAS